VVSVTSEVLANASFQGAPPRSARSDSDQASGNDSFSALVNSNAAAGNADNRSQDTSAAPTPAPRRADDSQATPDNRSRDNAAASGQAASDKAASDNAANNDSSDRDTATGARNDADADSKTETTRRSKSKSAASKSDAAKSDEAKPESKTAAADAAAITGQTQAAQDGTAEVTANGIAAVVPVTNTAAEASIATPASDKATAPLAIAAAAIAATASLTGTTAAATPAIDTAAATAPAATATAAKANGAKANPQATVSEAVTAQIASTDATVTTGIALAASVVATTPGASKSATQVKTVAVTKEGAATSGEQDSTTGTTTTTTTPGAVVPAITPQGEAAGKPKATGSIVDAARTDVAGTSAPASPPNAIGNGHAATAEAGQTLASAPDGSLQAAGMIQTQPPAATSTTQALAPQLNVTAATAQTAVPLSGLAMEIVATANSGKSRFEIRLDPADLGRIDVRIDVDRNGQVTSHLTVERPETLSMLRQDANQLQRALDNAGLSTGNSGLQFSLRDQSQQGHNDNSNPNAHRLIVAEEDTIPAAVAGRSYGRMLGSSGGVDIRV